MEFEPLIIAKISSSDTGNAVHELRKRGFQVLSTREVGIFTYVLTSISPKLVIKLCLHDNLDLKPPKRYSEFQALKLVSSGVEVIMRSKSIHACAAWIAQNPTVHHTLTYHENTRTDLSDICNYYGPCFALSFGFQELSVSYLQGLALVASIALIEILRNTAGASAAWLPLYYSYLSLWNVYYMQRWKQRKATLFYAWGIVDTEASATDLDLVQVSKIDSFHLF